MVCRRLTAGDFGLFLSTGLCRVLRIRLWLTIPVNLYFYFIFLFYYYLLFDVRRVVFILKLFSFGFDVWTQASGKAAG